MSITITRGASVVLSAPSGGTVSITRGASVVLSASVQTVEVNRLASTVEIKGIPTASETLFAQATITFNGGTSSPTVSSATNIFSATYRSTGAGQWKAVTGHRATSSWVRYWSLTAGSGITEVILVNVNDLSTSLLFNFDTYNGGTQVNPASGTAIHIEFWYAT